MKEDIEELEDDGEYTLEQLTPATLAKTVRESRKMIARGDFSQIEEQLIAQTVALESMFQIYFEKMIATEFLGAQEIFGQLALKAQSQCRKTLNTLVEMKNPKNLTFIKEQSNTQINVKQTSGDS